MAQGVTYLNIISKHFPGFVPQWFVPKLKIEIILFLGFVVFQHKVLVAERQYSEGDSEYVQSSNLELHDAGRGVAHLQC